MESRRSVAGMLLPWVPLGGLAVLAAALFCAGSERDAWVLFYGAIALAGVASATLAAIASHDRLPVAAIVLISWPVGYWWYLWRWRGSRRAAFWIGAILQLLLCAALAFAYWVIPLQHLFQGSGGLFGGSC
jgi:hypothetical protein